MSKPCILVAGGAGYIGSHMVKELLSANFDVITLDNLSTGHRELVTGGRFVRGDLHNPELLDRVFLENSIDAVMHFAAFSLVGDSVQTPVDYYQNNFCGTLSLVNAMVRHGVKRFIFSSTAAVYGEPEKVPIAETHPCVPTNPYGASKLTVERMLADCDRAYGLKYMSLRYFNAAGADASGSIGERHLRETHLIPLVLQVARSETPPYHYFRDGLPDPRRHLPQGLRACYRSCQGASVGAFGTSGRVRKQCI